MLYILDISPRGSILEEEVIFIAENLVRYGFALAGFVPVNTMCLVDRAPKVPQEARRRLAEVRGTRHAGLDGLHC